MFFHERKYHSDMRLRGRRRIFERKKMIDIDVKGGGGKGSIRQKEKKLKNMFLFFLMKEKEVRKIIKRYERRVYTIKR